MPFIIFIPITIPSTGAPREFHLHQTHLHVFVYAQRRVSGEEDRVPVPRPQPPGQGHQRTLQVSA